MPETRKRSNSLGVDDGIFRVSENVKSIPDHALTGMNNIKEIIVPDNVEEIGDSAFADCENLVAVRLPESVRVIPSALCQNDSSLREINVPKNVDTIGDYAFCCCSELENITLPDGIEKIMREAFYGAGLKSIKIPKTVYYIGAHAFQHCTCLTEVTMESEGLDLLGGAFADCRELQKVTLPPGIVRIKHGTFKNCMKLKSICIPESVRGIGVSAFANCESLKEITIPSMADKICSYAFSGCTGLETVTLSNGMTLIDDGAFQNCKSLKRIVFPDKLPEIANDVFRGVSDDAIFEYQGVDIPKKHFDFTESLGDGAGFASIFRILVAQHKILNDNSFSPILVTKLSKAEHKRKLSDAVEKYKRDFQTIGFYEIDDTVDVEMKEHLIQLFKDNAASHGVVPKIIDALTIAATTLNIEPERIVKSFEDKKFRDAIIAMRSCHEGNHFFDCEAALFAMTFDVNTVKQFILENPHKDYASVILCKGYKTGDEKYLNMAKWIAYHPDSSREMIEKLYKCQDYVEVRPYMTVDQVRAQVSCGEGELEIRQIEDRYDGKFAFKDCVCNLPKTEVELGRYKAYIMDGQDPRQVMLGYDTNCCQHLGGAGETAMMYGLANPNAGFFVIEDKETGKILAQAETWECESGYRSVRTEKINLQTVFNDNMNLANQLYKDVENYIEEGYCTDEYGTSEYADDYLTLELGFESWEIGDEKKAYGPVEGDEENIVAIVSNNESVEILDLSQIIDAVSKDSRLIKNFNEYVVHEAELTADGDLYKIECRKNDGETLVFDNIEFADDRQIDQFAPILGKWCEEFPYHDIIMGDGWNAMDNGKINHTNGVEPPVDGDMIWLMDKDGIVESSEDILSDWYPSPELAYEAIANKKINLEDYGIYDLSYDDLLPYTDADESCSILKADNQLEPYFRDLLEAYYEKHPEKRGNPKMEKDSEAEFDTKKEQKERHTGRGR